MTALPASPLSGASFHILKSTALLRCERRRCDPLAEIAQGARAERLLALLAAEGALDQSTAVAEYQKYFADPSIASL